MTDTRATTIRLSGLLLTITIAACAPLRPAVGRSTIEVADPDEMARTVDIPDLGVQVRIGAVTPIVRRGEFGILGGNPDGPMSATVAGMSTNIYFTCWDGKRQLSCLSENTSIDRFDNLSGLYRDPRRRRFRTVMAGGVPGDANEGTYAALQSTWRDPSTGMIHGWYHAEVPVNNSQPCHATYASIGYATSTDQGHWFTKQGIVLTSPYPNDPTACQGQGVQGPSVIQSDRYLYLFFTVGNTRDPRLGGIGIARSSTSAPRVWQHYYNGAFGESGIGGRNTPIITREDGDVWGPSVSWNSRLGEFVMLHSDYHNEGAIYLRTSRDLLSWSAPFVVVHPSRRYGYRYPTWLGLDDVTTGSDWLYFGRTPWQGSIGRDTLLARRTFVVEKIAP
jgi:hypothetical protein